MRCARFITAVLLAFSAGCSRPDPARVKVYPVEGQLIVSGIPAENALVAFHPLDENAARGICPVGLTRADGRFQMTSYSANDGRRPASTSSRSFGRTTTARVMTWRTTGFAGLTPTGTHHPSGPQSGPMSPMSSRSGPK